MGLDFNPRDFGVNRNVSVRRNACWLALLTRNKRTAEWTHDLNGLRETHARKPRLIEVLDRVERGRSRR